MKPKPRWAVEFDVVHGVEYPCRILQDDWPVLFLDPLTNIKDAQKVVHLLNRNSAAQTKRKNETDK